MYKITFDYFVQLGQSRECRDREIFSRSAQPAGKHADQGKIF